MPAPHVGLVRIGVDVGGTNTDAVALDISARISEHRGVLATCKTPTTPDVTAGIETAVRKVLDLAELPPHEISSVTVGTTHFINAVLERDVRRLQRVAVIRLSKSFLREIPPLSDFPPALAAILEGYVGYVDGGLHIDGSQEAPIAEEQVVRQCSAIKENRLTAVVVAGIFSPIDQTFRQESKVRDIILRELPNVDVVCSHEVANIGFMERENASILNAAILKYARRTIKGFRAAMRKLQLKCPLFLTQNDGTLLDAASAAKVPIRTFSSGATNSMRGASYLSRTGFESTSTIVVDIGGTTSDVGILLPSGLPRQASAYVNVAGVNVNYSMPHLHSIGLGGGSIVRQTNEKVSVGPDSVGHALDTEAVIFGGPTLTASDIAVASGRVSLGDADMAKSISEETIHKAQSRIKALLEAAIDVIKTSSDSLPVLLVGGGTILAPESLKGASNLIKPPFHDVANAVGAAISQVGGTVDMVQSVANQTQTQAVGNAKSLAIRKAVEAGAAEPSVFVAEVESLPVSYMANQLRTIVKAIGDLDNTVKPKEELLDNAEDEEGDAKVAKNSSLEAIEEPPVNHEKYRPRIVRIPGSSHLEWHISQIDLNYLADGCYVLGCAGGGSPGSTRLQLRDQLRAAYHMRIVDESALKADAVIYWGGHMGSPATSVERLNSTETVSAFKVLMEYLHHDSFDAVVGLEIGGANGLEPLLAGSSKFFDRPIVDADFMGRAYPTYWQTTLAVHHALELTPCAIDSGDGKSIVMTRAPNDEIVDRALRASCAEMGSRVGMAARPTTAERVRNCAVLNSYSLAWRIGRCIAVAEQTNTLSQVAEAIVQEAGGSDSAKVLFRGKIVGVERRLWKGHSYGEVIIASSAPGNELDEDETHSASHHVKPVAQGGTLKIPFKNENILAEHTDANGKQSIIASVPDLICILDRGSGRALGVPEFKYGFRVVVLGIACSPRWTDVPKGLEIGGPKAFGYDDVEHKPLGVYRKPRSVLAEFAPDT
ncbi:MAG: hypothetical protein M1822_009777 [Bathelium mastoideum]|nr:MAG: hypothetical protein M1822_009777 [Bathelium mastoideum]